MAAPTDPYVREKLVLKIVVAGICFIAVFILVFVRRVSLPVRLALAITDFIVAATLWLVMRQKFSSK